MAWLATMLQGPATMWIRGVRQVRFLRAGYFLRTLCGLLALNVPPSADALESGNAEDGAVLYQEYCSVCHGDKGDGMTRARRGLNPPPRDFTTAVARGELSRERMLNSVANGRPGTAMMPFAGRLTADQIEAVVDHIRASFMLRDEVPLSAEMLTEATGERIYISNCAVCHGDDGNGAMWTKSSLNPPPRDFTSASRDELSRERMINSVTYGRPGTAMMSFAARLSTDDIAAVVDFVRGKFLGQPAQARAAGAMPGHPPFGSAAPSPVSPVDFSLPFPAGLHGDAAKGGEFYMKNCITCHGERGDGQGPRSAFNRPPPRNFLSEDSRHSLNRPALFRAIGMGKAGTVMPAWSKVLTDQEIADVAEFVLRSFVMPERQMSEPQGESADEKKKFPADALSVGTAAG
jgi:mono/diheme cytochrome c family protein